VGVFFPGKVLRWEGFQQRGPTVLLCSGEGGPQRPPVGRLLILEGPERSALCDNVSLRRRVSPLRAGIQPPLVWRNVTAMSKCPVCLMEKVGLNHNSTTAPQFGALWVPTV
jgi:hypothetical protein